MSEPWRVVWLTTKRNVHLLIWIRLTMTTTPLTATSLSTTNDPLNGTANQSLVRFSKYNVILFSYNLPLLTSKMKFYKCYGKQICIKFVCLLIYCSTISVIYLITFQAPTPTSTTTRVLSMTWITTAARRGNWTKSSWMRMAFQWAQWMSH